MAHMYMAELSILEADRRSVLAEAPYDRAASPRGESSLVLMDNSAMKSSRQELSRHALISSTETAARSCINHPNFLLGWPCNPAIQERRRYSKTLALESQDESLKPSLLMYRLSPVFSTKRCRPWFSVSGIHVALGSTGRTTRTLCGGSSVGRTLEERKGCS
ncbi:hypothetical protein BP00DRAFT_8052 [Aspergillus indologenus CBS 114.80]|uniref:Uncharacterized protein n=1 Tax=Aspergillus indologenus CBS 114.80 TaxID=1450541 RepID=A0A2V5IRY2_9EURO|nr:hypothetical protein BP00DRAFT_8052 [Aspergillus indologenus CBS 114.80]